MTLTQLTEELLNLSQRSDGVLVLRSHKAVWNFHIFHGKLLYATDELYPVRRWKRAIEQHYPKWTWGNEFSQLSDSRAWECQLLERGISQRQLSPIRAKLVIRAVIQECLFELSGYTDLQSNWKPSQQAISSLYQTAALSSIEIQTVLTKAMKSQQQWQAAGLTHLSPTLSPVLKGKPGIALHTIPVADKYLYGQFTLWDIVSQLEKSVTDVTRSLLPLAEKNLLQFRKVSDLPVPKSEHSVAATFPRWETKPTQLAQKQPLIACVDDSPVLAHALKKILMSAGYQMLSIPEPMRGFSQLIEHKPELILLDLLLPNADGYSICKFLRETPVFKKTPIIILTAQNTQIDRFRAKQAGATEFLSKPPQSQELLQMVRKYLGKR